MTDSRKKVIEHIHPTTRAQRGFLLGSLSRPNISLYIEQSVIPLLGELDFPRFREALSHLSRHDILRTGFALNLSDEPRQVVLAESVVALGFVDVSKESRIHQEQQLQRLCEQDRRPFDFTDPPLLRVTLLKLSLTEYRLVWTHHHAILDGWSQMLLLDELLSLYHGRAIEPLDVKSFANYAAQRQAAIHDSSGDGWRPLFEGFKFPPALLVSEPEGDNCTSHDVARAHLAAGELTALEEFCREHGLTVAAALTSCWGLLTGQLRSSSEMAIGVTVSGRDPSVAGATKIVGPCVYTVPVVIPCGGDGDVHSWIYDVQRQIAETSRLGELSMAEIHARAGLALDRPLYDTVLAFANYPQPETHNADTLRMDLAGIAAYGGLTLHPLVLIAAGSEVIELRVVADRGIVGDGLTTLTTDRMLKLVCALPANPSLAELRGQLTDVSPLRTRDQTVMRAPTATPGTVEAKIASAFAEVLSRETDVGVNEDFIQLGGHSLVALELLRFLRQTLAVELTLLDVLQARTPRQLASRVRELERDFEPEEQSTVLHVDESAAFEPFPLTQIQRAYWAGRQEGFDLGGVDAHVYGEIDVQDLDLDRLEVAWNQLVLRHPMLRAVFTKEGEQLVLPEVPRYEIAVTDARDSTGPDLLVAIRSRLSHIRRDTSRWPLFTVECALLPKGIIRLFVSFDLLIGDALSWQILHRELHALMNEHRPHLPDLALTFRDYVKALEQLRHTPSYEHAERYWQARLDQLPLPPQLPLKRNAQKLDRMVFRRRQVMLDRSDTEALERLANELGVTLSVLLLSAFGETLRSCTESPAMIVNVTLYNRLRLHPQVDDIVGDFTSLLLLEIPYAEANFAARTRSLQNQLWSDLDHRQYSGLDALHELRRRRGNAAAPVVFTSTLDVPPTGRDAPPFPGKLVYAIGQTPQVFLDYQTYRLAGRLMINWDAVDDLFAPGFMDDAFALHVSLLQRLSHEDGASRAARPVPIAQKLALPAPLGGRRLLHEPFLEQVTKAPNAVAVITPEATLSYSEILSRAQALAAELPASPRKRQIVGVLASQGWEYVVGVLAALLAGCPFVPMDPRWPRVRLAEVIADTEMTTLLAAGADRCQLPNGLCVLAIDAARNPSSKPLFPGVEAQQPEELCYVIFTSGSTGKPKGVMISHLSALNTVLAINTRFDICSNDRVLALASTTFDLSIYDIFGALAAGATIIVPTEDERRDPPRLVAQVQRHGVTIWNSVPILMQLLLSSIDDGEQLNSLRLCLLSGDWLPVTLPAEIRRHAPLAHIVSLGGATEGAIWSIIYEVSEVDPDWSSIPYGSSLAGQCVDVLDEDLLPRPCGVPGEIFISGHGVAMGYWNDDQQTAAAFLIHTVTGDRLYRTGDWGRRLPSGDIELLGRRDDQVKVNGYRIELREIESVINELEGVEQASVIASGDRGERQLAAFLTGTIEESLVREHLEQRLPRYMVPPRIAVLAELPISATGKIDRKALLAKSAKQQSQVAPAAGGALTSTLELLQTLAAPLTDGELLGDTDDLLKLGMTSLTVVRFFNAIERSVGVRPKVGDFYREPTLEALALILTSEHAEPASSVDPEESRWTGWQLLLDPIEREAFRAARPKFPPAPVKRILSHAQPPDRVRYARRKSHRDFEPSPIPHQSFSDMLSCLRRVELESRAAFLYPSAGALYGVDAYIAVRSGRVEGISAGIYRYHPDAHDLIAHLGDVEFDSSLHEGITNRKVAEAAAFTILLVTDPAESVPLYGAEAPVLGLLNAGYIGQLLCDAATERGLGLCALHGFDFEAVRWLLPDGERVELLHLLVGGVPRSTGEALR